MAARHIVGARVLIVEDEYFLADDARAALSAAGAEVLGPVGTVADARALIEANAAIDWVLLDVNLRGEMAFEVGDLLRARGIPFAFVTGYDGAALPVRFSDTTVLSKPARPEQLITLFESVATPDRG